LKRRGIYISSDFGPFSQNPILALITPLFRGRTVMFPIPPKHSRREAVYIKEMIESGAFRPVIDRRYRLVQIVEAYRYVEAGQKIGNVVIEIVPSG
jgi:NADPH:quinone reductase-like Zn-dependent oxidoreductase